MPVPHLIVIHGMPATGKTTLARQLAKDLGLPQIGKDDIKELLFDRMGVGDREWSRTLGIATSEMLYPLLITLLKTGQSLIVESAFDHKFTVQRLAEIVRDTQASCIEIYCTVDGHERRRRFIERNESGARHPGHVDATNYDASSEETDKRTYAPLDIGKLIKIDTLEFGKPEYAKLLTRLHRELADN